MLISFMIYGMGAILLLSLCYAYLRRDRMITEKYPVIAPSGNTYRVQISYSGSTGKYVCNLYIKREQNLLGLEWKCVESEIVSHFFEEEEYDLPKIVSKIVLAYERRIHRNRAQHLQNQQERIAKEIEALESWDGQVKEEAEDYSI
jgi:hypothetical protein